MSKEKTDTQVENKQTISPDAPIYVEGASRQEVKAKLGELKSKAAKEGLKAKEGGFITFFQGEDGAEIFKSKITFKK